MAAIAEAAGVSHETVYATFGPKPALFRHLVEIALSGTDEPVPALERDIVRQVRAEPDPQRIIDLFAHTVRLLQERVAPLIVVLSDGARTDPDLKVFADELSAAGSDICALSSRTLRRRRACARTSRRRWPRMSSG